MKHALLPLLLGMAAVSGVDLLAQDHATHGTAGQKPDHMTNLPEPVDVDTYHHIPNRGAYFTALRALLKPGGRLAIVDFKKDSPDGPPVEFRFTPAQMTAELAKAGFTLQAEHDFLPRQMFLVYRAK